MERVCVCKLDLFNKENILMDSEVKRLYKSKDNAIKYIKEQVDAYMDAYSGEAYKKEEHDGFVEIGIRGWTRRYYYVLKTLND